MKLYIDLDGVLADFNKSAKRVLRTDNHYHYDFVWGPETYWARLHERDPHFFANLDQMPDAWDLWDAVQHLKPTILTALPKTGADKVEEQKRKWVRENIGWDVEVITGATKDKPKYCKPGDILIDDRAINMDAWNAKGGTYLLHTTAERTIGALRALGVIE